MKDFSTVQVLQPEVWSRSESLGPCVSAGLFV